MAHHNHLWQEREKPFTTVQNIVVGTNSIVHNLNLADPQGFTLELIDATNNSFNISNFTSYTANSFTWNSAIARPNVHFTVR